MQGADFLQSGRRSRPRDLTKISSEHLYEGFECPTEERGVFCTASILLDGFLYLSDLCPWIMVVWWTWKVRITCIGKYASITPSRMKRRRTKP